MPRTISDFLNILISRQTHTLLLPESIKYEALCLVRRSNVVGMRRVTRSHQQGARLVNVIQTVHWKTRTREFKPVSIPCAQPPRCIHVIINTCITCICNVRLNFNKERNSRCVTPLRECGSLFFLSFRSQLRCYQH